jgi:hypothetical protein
MLEADTALGYLAASGELEVSPRSSPRRPPWTQATLAARSSSLSDRVIVPLPIPQPAEDGRQ